MRLLFIQIGLFILGIIGSVAQDTKPYADIQPYPCDSIKKYAIYKISAYEFEPMLDTVAVSLYDSLAMMYSIQYFDTLGRITNNTRFWAYSDMGSTTYEYSYDSLNRLIAVSHALDSVPERLETFTYDSLSRLTAWKVILPNEKKNAGIEKRFVYDSTLPTSAEVSMGKKVFSKEKYTYTIDSLTGASISMVHYVGTNYKDSVTVLKGRGDTLQHVWTYKENLKDEYRYVVKDANGYFTRKEIYIDGAYMGVLYEETAFDGRVLREQSIHHFPLMNYTKEYLYDKRGFLERKIIYGAATAPQSVIRFIYHTKNIQ